MKIALTLIIIGGICQIIAAIGGIYEKNSADHAERKARNEAYAEQAQIEYNGNPEHFKILKQIRPELNMTFEQYQALNREQRNNLFILKNSVDTTRN